MQNRFIMVAIFLGIILALREEVRGNATDAEVSLKVEHSDIAIDRSNQGEREQNGGIAYDGGLKNGGREKTLQVEEEDGNVEREGDGGRFTHDTKYFNRPSIVLGVRESDYYPTSNYTSEGGGGQDDGGEDEDDEESAKDSDDNCTHPRQPFPWYNDSCDFVHAECGGKSELIDYLAFVLCDLPKAQVPTHDSV